MQRYRKSLVPIELLQPHEEIVEWRARRVLYSILGEGRVLRPIIVSSKGYVIIDGHHRYYALKRMGARLAPVVLAEYGVELEGIGVETRYLSIPLRPSRSLDLVAGFIEDTTKRGPGELVVRGPLGERVVVSIDPLDFYMYTAKRLYELDAGRGTVVAVEPPPLRPSDVIRAASRGVLLAPKSTIHQTFLKRVRDPTRLTLLF